MKMFASVTPAPVPKTKNVTTISIFLAAILVVMAVAQLFSFEEFLLWMASLTLFPNDSVASLVAALIVVSEVFALPFLLRLQTSPLMRVFSMGCGWLVAGTWLVLTSWMVFFGEGVTNVGFLGDVVELTPGWWAVFMSLSLAILSAWASWGMWPKLHLKH